MIDIKNLNVELDNKVILKNINYSFPVNGLVCICGESGSGKTTLLKTIYGLNKYSGIISFKDCINSKITDEYRLKHIGFIFQDFKLFEYDNIYNNVVLPLDINSGETKEKKEKKVDDLLTLVDVKKKGIVSKLSGGEKQRISISRSLVNDANIILADEPTGALDEVNGIKTFELLRRISYQKLVIVVTHDKEMASKYADEIITLKDGEIIDNKKQELKKDLKGIFVTKSIYSNHQPKLPLTFSFRHALNTLKCKKWRAIITSIVTSLGLIGVGLAFSISSIISTNIKSAYSGIANEERIVVSLKKPNEESPYIEGAEYEDALDIKYNYPEYINDVGVIYTTNFNNHFKDYNKFSFSSNAKVIDLPMLTANQINDYFWLDEINQQFYPSKPMNLNNDDIVIGINLSMLQTICLGLNINRSIDALSDYIATNEIRMSFKGINNDWEYEDEEVFTLRAVTLSFTPCIYQYNHMWNQYVFEKLMRFPSNRTINIQDKEPWMLKKLYYLNTNDNRDEFFSLTRTILTYDNYLFEIASSSEFPITIKEEEKVSNINKVLFLTNTRKSISTREVKTILNNHKELKNTTYGTRGGYAIYSSGLLVGFSDFSFFSFDNEFLQTSVNNFAKLTNEEFNALSNEENLLIGHFSKMNEGVKFREIDSDFALKTNEIYVSSGLLKYLKGSINSYLFLSKVHSTIVTNSGNIIRTFVDDKLYVKGVINNDEYCIYQNADWTLDYFKNFLGVSASNMLIDNVCFSYEGNDIESEIISLRKDFPELEIINPMTDINRSIDDVCQKIEIILSSFSILCTVVSIILLLFSSYLSCIENKKDVNLLRILGLKKSESKKLFNVQVCLNCAIAFVIACVELVIINVVLNGMMVNMYGSSSRFVFNPFSILVMLFLILIIGCISTLLVNIMTKKELIE